MHEIMREGRVIQVDENQDMTVKELAYITRHSEGYIYAMKRCGFPMKRPLGCRLQVATFQDYLDFHSENPDFLYETAYSKK